MATKFELDGVLSEVLPVTRGSNMVLTIDDRKVTVQRKHTEPGLEAFVVDGRNYTARVARQGDTLYVHLDGKLWPVQAINAIDAAGSGRDRSSTVVAPMPGVVIDVAVSVGDVVAQGQTLMVIESMKLQTSILAERDGVIAEIHFDAEDTFDKGVDLLRFEEPEV